MKKNKPYIASPAPGEALLAYQGRVAPATELPVFEAETVEEVRAQNGELGGASATKERNLLIQGDCLSACAWLRENKIAVDLVYIDPPFASGADYAKKIFLRNGSGKDALTGDSSIGEDVAYGDIWQKEDYLNWLFARLVAIREVMSETASIYVHLDWHIGHYVKVLLDEIFGEENFRNEIVWHYEDKFATGGKTFDKNHDCIYFYTKGQDYFSRPIVVKKEKTTRRALRKKIGGETVDVRDENGGKVIKEYAEKRADDVWRFDNILETGRSVSVKERVDYPTQKPEALARRIIEASSDEGMLVADFFSGSGTAARAAHKLGRRFVVSDIGANAIQTSRDTLKKAGASFDALKIRDGIRLIRNPSQTAQATHKILSARPGWTSRKDAELSDFWDGGVVDSKGKITPMKFIGLSVKLTRKLLGGVLAEIAETEGARDDVAAAEVVYAHKDDDVDQQYADKAAAEARHSTVQIRLISLDDFLGERAAEFFPEDSAQIEVAPAENGGCRVSIARFFSPYLKAKIDDHNGDRELTSKKAVAIGETGLELIESAQFAFGPARKVWRVDLEDRADKKSKIRGVYDLPVREFRLKSAASRATR